MRALSKSRFLRFAASPITGVAVLSAFAMGCFGASFGASQSTLTFPVPGGDAASLYPPLEQCAASAQLAVTHKSDSAGLAVVIEDGARVTYDAAGGSLQVGVRIEGLLTRERKDRVFGVAGRIYRCAVASRGR
jgi:hypothetical protein